MSTRVSLKDRPVQARLFDQRELKAERVLAEALTGDLIVVFKHMRKQKKSARGTSRLNPK